MSELTVGSRFPTEVAIHVDRLVYDAAYTSRVPQKGDVMNTITSILESGWVQKTAIDVVHRKLTSSTGATVDYFAVQDGNHRACSLRFLASIGLAPQVSYVPAGAFPRMAVNGT